MKFLADENLREDLVDELRHKGFKVRYIREDFPGLGDENIIRLAKQNDYVLITEDKDFGEWGFAGKVNNISVIFIQYKKGDYEQVKDSLLEFLKQSLDNLRHKFVTIKKHKIRIREIYF
jgi:predicted nuclease of predicted toxin-antitoxin system